MSSTFKHILYHASLTITTKQIKSHWFLVKALYKALCKTKLAILQMENLSFFGKSHHPRPEAPSSGVAASPPVHWRPVQGSCAWRTSCPPDPGGIQLSPKMAIKMSRWVRWGLVWILTCINPTLYHYISWKLKFNQNNWWFLCGRLPLVPSSWGCGDSIGDKFLTKFLCILFRQR